MFLFVEMAAAAPKHVGEKVIINTCILLYVGARLATGCGLDGPGIESWRGRDFSHTFRLALGPTQPPVQWVLGLFRE
jgi:hypothetical protein